MSLISKLLSVFSKDKNVLKKIVLTTFTRGISAVGTFLLSFVLAKVLSIEEYGKYMLAYTILVGLSFLVKFGMPNAIMRFVSIMFSNRDFVAIKKIRYFVYKFGFLISLLCVTLMILFRGNIANLFFQDDVSLLIVTFAIILPFFSYLPIQSSYFKAFKKPQIAPFFETGLTTFLTSITVYIGYYFLGYQITKEIAAVIFLSSCVIVVTFGHFKLNKYVSEDSDNSLSKASKDVSTAHKDFKDSLLDYTILSITNYILKFSPVLILGFYVAEDQVGLYSITNSISFLITFILLIINNVYAPYYSIQFSENKIQELRKSFLQSIFYMLIIAVPIFLIIMIFPYQILSIFGEKYTSAVLGVRILAVSQLINILTGPSFFLLNMTGNQKELRNIVSLCAILTILLSFILIKNYGYMGAVLSTAIGFIIQNLYSFFLVSKKLKLNILKRFVN